MIFQSCKHKLNRSVVVVRFLGLQCFRSVVISDFSSGSRNILKTIEDKAFFPQIERRYFSEKIEEGNLICCPRSVVILGLGLSPKFFCSGTRKKIYVTLKNKRKSEYIYVV